jgi:PIN domain nuclease of toxin-antitoxin system
MRALLDTHALLWWLFDDPRLSQAVRGIVADPDNEILVSSASAWEISTKYRLGKLPRAAPLARDIEGWIERAGFGELAVTIPHAQRAGSWPHEHRDPFDRMLAAQSALEALPLVTRDEAFSAFGIQVVW